MAKTTTEKTSKLTSLMNFIREAKAELKKVTWPTRKQIWYWTLVVIVFTLCVSLYLGLIDFLLAWLFSALLG
ncbi:MAG: preprotein translocase subunit SecE [Synergistaceae bacterium]|nr:preprotein translocase subunit SecE [Synergistaceae bacterium]MBQ3448695.1 preprotein translocase subunit SecE [Synergistaceae bacterium]MBQ3695129.1 preprotein translocase subunit SecE [Synergistaceae bacterium]MBQ6112530.1 preprotein translocase subunit SecE [Synergistaceae bacterium]MBQ9629473.1 preprotein translocase subunit SecE [Synergistaceae bacterium]